MIIGAAYYPEHWDSERWETDCRLMKEMGINAVRIGEFGWSVMEREEGNYDFSLYDEAMSRLYEYGISVILGTPTATPPAWLCEKYPDIYMEDQKGIRRGFGSRRHYCYNHRGYREASAKIVTAMADYFREDSRVIAWQIDNELGCEDEVRCYCEDCRQEFIKWLKRKYQTLERVNKVWGTVFWSQIYTDWGQITLPKQTVIDAYTGYSHNPGLLLDFARFSSDSLIDFAKEQYQLLKRNVSKPIIHNVVSEYCDNYKLMNYLDGAGYDAYPRSEWDCSSPGRIGFHYDLTRGYDDKKPFWILEQQSGPCGWNVLGDTPQEGQLRLWSFQGAARGAEALVYFRWRTCLFGTEQLWYGILDHDGIPRKRYIELKEAADIIQKYEPIFKLQNQKQVLLVYDYDNKFSHEFQPHIREFCYKEEIIHYYEALQKMHVSVDVSDLKSDFSVYKVLILPFVSMITEETVKRLEVYVQQGGILILTPFTGQREMNNCMSSKTLPGAFQKLSGVSVEEFFCGERLKGQVIHVQKENETLGEIRGWCEVLNPCQAETVGVYHGVYGRQKQQEAAITKNSFGQGRVYYLASLYEDYEKPLKMIFQREGVEGYSVEAEVECIAKAEGKYLILLNHSSISKCIKIEHYQNIEEGREELRLEPFGIAIAVRRA